MFLFLPSFLSSLLSNVLNLRDGEIEERIHLGFIRPGISSERDRSATQGLLFNEWAHVALQCIVFNVEQWTASG